MPFFDKKGILGTRRVDSHTPLPKRQPQSLRYPLWESKTIPAGEMLNLVSFGEKQ